MLIILSEKDQTWFTLFSNSLCSQGFALNACLLPQSSKIIGMHQQTCLLFPHFCMITHFLLFSRILLLCCFSLLPCSKILLPQYSRNQRDEHTKDCLAVGFYYLSLIQITGTNAPKSATPLLLLSSNMTLVSPGLFQLL